MQTADDLASKGHAFSLRLRQKLSTDTLSDMTVQMNKSCTAWFGVTRVSCESRVRARQTHTHTHTHTQSHTGGRAPRLFANVSFLFPLSLSFSLSFSVLVLLSFCVAYERDNFNFKFRLEFRLAWLILPFRSKIGILLVRNVTSIMRFVAVGG